MESGIDKMNEHKDEGGKTGKFGANISLILFFIFGIAIVGTLYMNYDLSKKVSSLSSEITALKNETTYLKNSLTTSPIDLNKKINDSNVSSKLVMFGNYTFDLTGLEPRGNPDAPITIIEYSDFQCPFCSKVQPTIEQILKDYDGKVKIYYEQFPLTQIHPNAQKAAEASLLAAEQGKFWEYHDILFKNQDKLDVKYLKEYASQLGLDAEKFNYGLDSGIKAQTVNKNLQEGIKNGVQGTPTFFINGHILTGAQPYSVFKQIIDSELNRLEQ
ncbi:MAG: DsbA family protein [Candidatus Micrarchaeota archaeon]|nr:DsbA family protein [Candidatus Micrarchaeota archaeon]